MTIHTTSKSLWVLVVALLAGSVLAQENAPSISIRNRLADRGHQATIEALTEIISNCGPGRKWECWGAYGYEVRGIAYYRVGKLDNAQADLRRALDEGPSGRVQAFLGHIQFEHGKLDEAMKLYDLAVKDQWNRADGYLGYGNVFRRKKQYDKAIEAFNRAIFEYPRFSSAYYNLGFTYFEMWKQCDLEARGKCEKGDLLHNALKAFESAESMDLILTQPQLYFYRAKTYDALGKPGKAEADRAKYDEMAATEDR